MTMSERTITVRLTGPQYRALLSAIDLASNEWEQDGVGPNSQSHQTVERARTKIVKAWNRVD